MCFERNETKRKHTYGLSIENSLIEIESHTDGTQLTNVPL